MTSAKINQLWNGRAFLDTKEHEAIRAGYVLGAAWVAVATGSIYELASLSLEDEKALGAMLDITSKVLNDKPVRRDEVAAALETGLKVSVPIFKEIMAGGDKNL